MNANRTQLTRETSIGGATSMKTHRLQSEQGIATVEFSMIAVVLLVLAFGIIEFGSLIQAQAVVTNVGREGGNLASRDLKTGQDLLTLLAASSTPLDFQGTPERYKIYIAKADAATSDGAEPTCTVQESGTLSGTGVESPAVDPRCGLTNALYGYLQYDAVNGAAAISQFTIVKVYYTHVPLTPFVDMLEQLSGGRTGILNFDLPDTDGVELPDSLLIGTTAIF